MSRVSLSLSLTHTHTHTQHTGLSSFSASGLRSGDASSDEKPVINLGPAVSGPGAGANTRAALVPQTCHASILMGLLRLLLDNEHNEPVLNPGQKNRVTQSPAPGHPRGGRTTEGRDKETLHYPGPSTTSHPLTREVQWGSMRQMIGSGKVVSQVGVWDKSEERSYKSCKKSAQRPRL
jgi:hypothetical protein